MKKYSFLVYITLLSLLLTSCIKEDDKTFTGNTVVEIDQTVLNGVAAGITYPILTRIPFSGRPLVGASDSTIRRWNNTTLTRIRVNLVGPQSSKDQTVTYVINNTPPVASVAYTVTASPNIAQTPSAPAATLTLAAATIGVHYVVVTPGPSGIITIPANSSFGYIDVQILNAGATAGQARYFGIELTDGGTVKPNPNYSKLGIAIDQR